MPNDEARMTKMGVHYFYGPDTYAAREALTDLAKQEKARLYFLEPEQLDERTLKERLTAGGGMFGKDMFVIRDPSQLIKNLQEVLVDIAHKKPKTAIVLWDQEQPREKSLVFTAFRETGKFFAELAPEDVAKWLTQEARQRGVTLSQDVAMLLWQRLGSDRFRLLSELERLSLTEESLTTQRVVEETVPLNSEGEIFELLRAVTAGKRDQALQEFQNLLESGESELYIVSMLAYQFRTLYLLSRGKTQGVSPGAARALTPVAKRRAPAAWLNDLTRVVAADFAIKQGKTDMRTGVTMLILGLVGSAIAAPR